MQDVAGRRLGQIDGEIGRAEVGCLIEPEVVAGDADRVDSGDGDGRGRVDRTGGGQVDTGIGQARTELVGKGVSAESSRKPDRATEVCRRDGRVGRTAAQGHAEQPVTGRDEIRDVLADDDDHGFARTRSSSRSFARSRPRRGLGVAAMTTATNVRATPA